LKKAIKLGIGFTGSPYSASQIAELAKLAERSRFYSIWIAEDYFLRDSITLLSTVASATKEIKLSSGIINPFTRHPALIAQTAATLDELSKGRYTLGLGSGELKLIASMGRKVDHPLGSMRESVDIIRSLLSGKETSFEGKYFAISKARLGINPYISRTDDDKFGRYASKVRIYLAAIGPKMLDLAAKIGDGVLLTAGITTETARQSILNLKKARAESNGVRTAFSTAGYIVTCLDKPSSLVKLFVADMANSWPQNFIESGVIEKHVDELRHEYIKRGIRGATSLVTDDMIRAVVACGRRYEVEEKIFNYWRSGLAQPILIPMDTRARDLIVSLGN
jgi:5,10-methylenetetrahydromethanopterin reductase